MKPESFIAVLMGRGIPSALAQRVKVRFSDWEALCAAGPALLAEHFAPEELDTICRAKTRREISRETVNRLIDDCGLRCCLCWNIDHDTGVVIHHIRPHATEPDDRYENLVVLCTDHHSKVHTKWELARHPYPPELLLRRKADFAAAIAAFRAGKRVAPGREKNATTGLLVSPPLPPPHFIGRDILARAIGEELRSRGGRAAIVGMGGVGKTALALKVADACREDFPGGILWAEVATDFGGTPEILRTWIISLGHDVAGMKIEEQLALFADLLRKRAAIVGRLLLLIDDVGERVAKDLVKLISYVPPDVSIVITTREATVSTSVGATQFRAEPLERADCRQLLESVSGSALVRTEQRAVDTLLSLLGDLPLAVELVARQIAVRERKPEFSIGGLCRRLQEFDPEILSFPGHRGIAMSFALSYEHLDANEQRVFRSFGIFASGSIDTTSIAAVGMAEKEETESTLDRLVVVSMLDWGTGAGEYRIHPLLHKYSEFLFSRSDAAEQGSTRLHFYQHYTSVATAACKNSPNDLQAIDRIFPNLTKAIQFAAASRDHLVVSETMLHLSAGMNFFILRNLEHESIPLLELAIAATKHLGDRDRESPSTGHLGTAYARLGMIRDAVEQFGRAVAIARETGNEYDLASHLHNLGSTLLSESKDLPRAERLLHEALTAAERSQNVDVVIACFSSLGNLHRQVGNLTEAARLYAGALEASRLAGNRLSEGNSLSNLGLVTDQLGDAAEGERMIRDALAIAIEIGDKRGEGNRTGHLGGILLAKARRLPPGPEQSGTLESAREHVTIAMRIAQETGDAEKAGSWLMNLGHVCLLERNIVEGIKQIEAALGVAEAGGFALLEAQAHFNLGSVMARQGQLQLALGHFRASNALLRKMGSPMAAKAEAYISRLNEMLKS